MPTRLVFLLAAGVLASSFAGPGAAMAPSTPQDVAGSVPANLGPNDYFQGQQWQGTPGITEIVAEIQGRQLAQRGIRPHRMMREHGEAYRAGEPPSPLIVQAAPGLPEQFVPPHDPLSASGGWTAIHASESGAVPPDAMGAAGPTQVVVLANGRFKVFDKAGKPGPLDVDDNIFFSPVIAGTSTYPCDPRVRYDRLSERWFITEITCGGIPAGVPNRILIAVSSGPTITSDSSFTFFQFQQDLVGTTPNSDTTGFADYPTLGVDATAIYIGANIFDCGGRGCLSSGFVVNKTKLLAGLLSVTAFRQLARPLAFGSYGGLRTPQGVDNDDPAATEGYFIGVNAFPNPVYSDLQMRRVLNPGGTPSISGNISVDLSPQAIYAPMYGQQQMGSTKRLDTIDARLFGAMMKKNKLTGVSSLWTALNIRTNGSGFSDSHGNRTSMRWYQLDNLMTSPTMTRGGTQYASDFDGSPAGAGYWMGSVAANGQGHMALVSSFSSAADYAGVKVTWRMAGSSQSETPSVAIAGAAAYVDWTGFAVERWGDYSMVAVDPTDDQTMWAFAEYAYSADPEDAWAVRVIKLVAPPPATPVDVSPGTVAPGRASATLTLTGRAAASSGFFDPGAGYANRLNVAISGGVVVNSVTFVSPTSLTLDISTVGATPGPKDVTITNPDGQQVVGQAMFVTTPPEPAAMVAPAQTTLTVVPVSFAWTPGNGTTQYWLDVGTFPGGRDLYSMNQGAARSALVSGIALNGRALYVRLWSLIGTAWIPMDYVYGRADVATRALLTRPAAGATTDGPTLTSTPVAFAWTSVPGATQYWLDAGTRPGARDLYSANQGAALATTVTNIPLDGTPLYVRLWTCKDGNWLYVDYTYGRIDAATMAVLTVPDTGPTTDGPMITRNTVVFRWSRPVPGLLCWLDVGTTTGGREVFTENQGLVYTTVAVPGIPLNGLPLYVRLWTRDTAGVWRFIDYTFARLDESTTATLTRPSPGTTTRGTTIAVGNVSFGWTEPPGATQYWLDVGTTLGGRDVYTQNQGAAVGAVVPAIPLNGQPLYVRLWTRKDGVWRSVDFSFDRVNEMSTGLLTAPAPGATTEGPTLTTGTVRFSWTEPPGAALFWLDLGTTRGGRDLYTQNQGPAVGGTVSGIPLDGTTLYVRLWTLKNGAWGYVDYTFGRVDAAATAILTTPSPGATTLGPTITSSSVTFEWGTLAGAAQYWLDLGSTPGGREIYTQAQGTGLSASVAGIPLNGCALYVRIWTLKNGSWRYVDYTFGRVNASTTSVLTSPASTTTQGPNISTTSVTFSWIDVTGASQYWLDLGSTPGGRDIYTQNQGAALSTTVSGLGLNGAPLYVRLWTLLNGEWRYLDYAFPR